MNGAMNRRGEHDRSWGARLIVLVPYLWLATFFLLPFLIVVKISLSHTAIAQPPYTPVFDPAADWESFKGFLLRFFVKKFPLPGFRWPLSALLSKAPGGGGGLTLPAAAVGFP